MAEAYQKAVDGIQEGPETLDPKTKLGEKILSRLVQEMGYQIGDEIGADDLSPENGVTPELLQKILVESLEGETLEDIVALRAEGGGNPLWDTTSELAVKIQEAIAKAAPHHSAQNVDGVRASNLNDMGAHGVYFPGSKEAYLDAEMMVSESSPDYIAGVLDHELIHVDTHDITQALGAVVVKNDGSKVELTHTELIEGLTEGNSVENTGEKDVYNGPREKIIALFGMEGYRTLKRLFIRGQAKEFQDAVSDQLQEGAEVPGGLPEATRIEVEKESKPEIDGEGNIHVEVEAPVLLEFRAGKVINGDEFSLEMERLKLEDEYGDLMSQQDRDDFKAIAQHIEEDGELEGSMKQKELRLRGRLDAFDQGRAGILENEDYLPYDTYSEGFASGKATWEALSRDEREKIAA